MEYLSILAMTVLAVLIVQLLRIVLSDCDLALQWAARFGKSTAVLRGKVVWITGASSGIGEYLAYELASAGCRLVLSARREGELERVKTQCLAGATLQDEDIMVLPLDVLKFDSHSAAVRTVISAFGKIDILVNNAGRGQVAMWEEVAVEVDRHLFEVNVLGCLSLTKAVLPCMIEQGGGHVVVMSSFGGKFGVAGCATYSGTKHALQGCFDSLRMEGYDRNIAVTIVCPGAVDTDIFRAAFTETPGKALNWEANTWEGWSDLAIPIVRLAQLTTIAIANQLDEVWIAKKPLILMPYIMQFMPSFGRRLMTRSGSSQLKMLRERLDRGLKER